MARDGGAIVTGASRGIGAAIAVALADRGFTVACVSRSGTLPATVAAGDVMVPYECDVTDAAGVKSVVEDFASRAGGIAALVNNAGAHLEAAAVDVRVSDLMAMFELHCVGSLLFAQAVRPYLAASHGVIVGMGSFFDKLGARGSLAYAASKAALASMNRALAVEWAPDGISVFTVAPGYVLTDLNADWLADPDTRRKIERRIPASRIGAPSEVGRLVASLIAEDIGFLTGETIYVDGGQAVRV
jgi:NAD(P)-dependent dehydrogenase (short-subunit alcohol dehydrogenase family)